MGERISHVMIDVYLAEIEHSVERITTGNVGHDVPAALSLVRALRRRLDRRRKGSGPSSPRGRSQP